MNTIQELDIFTRLFLLLIFLALFIRVCYVYFTLRGDQRFQDPNFHVTPIQHPRAEDKNTVMGLARSIINSYHTFPFDKKHIATINKDSDYDTICSICISDYKEQEILKVMPQCRHYFHRDCVDIWLKVNASCPICRNSLLQGNDDGVSNLEVV